MEKRQMIILCKIGSKNIDYKSVTDIKVERNFSDVADKFSIDLIDSPEVMTYDLELYMNAGYRGIIFKYGDLSSNKLISYKGTIWDYTNTFVGNKKKLTITGICDRYTGNEEGAATYLYNIDWNSYINKRENEYEPYGSIQAENIRLSLDKITSAILNNSYRNSWLVNSKKLKLTGPSKNSINLPIPDSFFPITEIPDNPEALGSSDLKNNYPEFYNAVKDPEGKYWGELHTEKTTKEEIVCGFPNLDMAEKLWKKDGNTVGCEIKGELYILITYMLSCYNSAYVTPSKQKLPDNYNVYNNQGFTEIEGLLGPLQNKRFTFNNTDYVVIQDKNNKTVGFRTDNSLENKDNNCYINLNSSFLSKDKRRKETLLNALTVVPKAESEIQDVEDKTNYLYFYDKNNKLRGFISRKLKEDGSMAYDTFYIQANPNAINFGSSGFVKSGAGVNISWIVKQLAILEGWKLYYDSDGNTPHIVQTELVPNAETFIMQNQSAFEFIQKNLIPKSVTPIGYYTIKSGELKYIDEPQGGFGIFFDKNGYLHYQPISQTNLEDLNIPNLGYNIPNSPLLSFQVNTKGTAFYNFQNTTLNTTTITSGVETTAVEIASDEAVEEIKNTPGHNDTFDAWLGLNYNTVQKLVNSNDLIPSKDSPYKSFSIDYNEDYTPIGDSIQNLAIGLAQNALVSSPTTKLVSSGVYSTSDIRGNMKKAISLIEDFTITANLNMWGDYRIKPAGIITITNMVTGGINNSNIPTKHPTSGKYMIQSVSEAVSSSGWTQSLNLIRFTEDLNSLINPYNIDYSVGAFGSNVRADAYKAGGGGYVGDGSGNGSLDSGGGGGGFSR